MGTMLYSKGVFINQCYDELNVRAPDLVRDIHAQYVNAGADVHRDEQLRRESIEARAARTAGSGEGVESGRGDDRARSRRSARARRRRRRTAGRSPRAVRADEQGRSSRDLPGADGRCSPKAASTSSSSRRSPTSTRSSRRSSPRGPSTRTMPIIAQMTIGADGLTPYGAPPRTSSRASSTRGAPTSSDSIAPSGRRRFSNAIEKMAPATRRKLSAQPNAGMPRDVGGRSMYMASPEYMATYARHLVQAGAKIVGGCCGTTPEHIHAMVEGIRPLTPRARRNGGDSRAGSVDAAATARPSSAVRPYRRTGAIRRALAAGRRSSATAEFVYVRRDRAAARRRCVAHDRRRRAS